MMDLDKKYVKLYKVTFNSYTNALYNTVRHSNDFLHIPETGLVIREDELDIYKEYGNGFASLTIVGEMLVEE